MRITVLGKSPSWQDAGGACSGYLVQEGDYRLLVDCGSGVFGKLRSVLDYRDVDAVIVSHLHADHFFDLVPFASALTYGPRRSEPAARPALHAPPGAGVTFDAVTEAWGSPRLIADAFAVREYDPAETLTLGPLRVRFQPVPHFVTTYALELTDSAGRRFLFGADGAPSPELARFAAGADLLMLEATLSEPESGGVRGHMTPAEAAATGALAGAGRLVLTHISDELDADWALREARAGFPGAVDVATDGAVFDV